jgi:hypothetical protein
LPGIPSLETLLIGIEKFHGELTERFDCLASILIGVNKLRNEIVHSSYGIPSDAPSSEELRQLLPLSAGCTIRERRNPKEKTLSAYVTDPHMSQR